MEVLLLATFKVVTGVMGSGKSANAIITVLNLLHNGQTVKVIKPYADSRDEDRIASRIINDVIQADYFISEADDISKLFEFESVNYIIVDEAHMLSVEQVKALYDICARRNINVTLLPKFLDLWTLSTQGETRSHFSSVAKQGT